MRQRLAGVEFRAPQTGDALSVARMLRAADRAELQAAGLIGPREWRAAIEDGIKHSPLCWTAVVDGLPAAVLGCRPLPDVGPDIAAPWFLGTDAVWRKRRAFVAIAPSYIRLMQSHYPRLMNEVHADNAQAVRMLEALGFDLAPPYRHPETGAPFRVFTMEHLQDGRI